VLNSCEGAKGSDTNIFSSTSSILMRRGVPAVVAMQYEITDRAAIEFSQVFYEDIAHGLAVDTAVTEARKAISMSMGSSLEWGTPVLHMRAPDGVLFDIRGTPQPVARVEPAPTPPTAPPIAPPIAPTPSSLSAPAGKSWRFWERHPARWWVGAAVIVFAGLGLYYFQWEGWAPPPTERLFLAEDFSPDPYWVDVDAGGDNKLDQPGCTHGYVPHDPNVILAYTGGQPLSLLVEDRNVTIHVKLPDDSWRCNDPAAPGDPQVVVPSGGVYQIWVGAAGEWIVSASLLISKRGDPLVDDEEDQAGAF
jgi:hypothetical protein